MVVHLYVVVLVYALHFSCQPAILSFLVCELCSPVAPCIFFFFQLCHPRTCGRCVIHARAPTPMTNSYTLPSQSSPRKIAGVSGHSYVRNEGQKNHPQRISCYWWLFWTQHLPHYSARLVQLLRRKENFGGRVLYRVGRATCSEEGHAHLRCLLPKVTQPTMTTVAG